LLPQGITPFYQNPTFQNPKQSVTIIEIFTIMGKGKKGTKPLPPTPLRATAPTVEDEPEEESSPPSFVNTDHSYDDSTGYASEVIPNINVLL
jgi:hypothetical protein